MTKTIDPPAYANIVPERIIDLVKKRTPALSRGQTVVADYILKNPSTFWFLSVQELAAEAGVSHATVIRFCQALGYEGFSEFSQDAQKIMQLEITLANRFSLRSIPDDRKSGAQATLFKKTMRLALDSIEEVARNVSEKDIKTCVDMMEKADAIYILARMSSFPIALHFENTLSKACTKSYIVPESALQATSILKRIDNRSLLFSIAYTRYATDTLSFTEMAAEKGCKIVAITNSLVSPLASLADLNFIVPVTSFSFADIFAGPFSLVAALSLEYGLRCEQSAAQSLAEFDKVMVQRGHVVK